MTHPLMERDVPVATARKKVRELGRAKVKREGAFVVDDPFPAFDHKMIVYIIEVDGHKVRCGHWSGKYSGSVKVLARWLKRCARKYQLDIITTTESQQRGARIRVSARMGRKWGVKQRGEYLCIYRKATFFAMPAVDPLLKTYTKIAGYAGWRNMRAGVFTLRHKETGRPFTWWVFHGPSGIQRGNSWSGEKKQVQIAKVGYPRLGAEMDRMADKKPHGVRIGVGDTNWHAGEPMGLNFIEDSLDAKAVFRPGSMPKQGTHRNSGRVIDNAFIQDAA